MAARNHPPRDSRAAAAWVLANLVKQQGSLASLLPVACAQLPEKDHAFMQALCYGACRHWQALNQQAASLLDKKLRNKDADVHALLLLGLYQLFYLRTPDHAAVAATVQATRALKKPWASGLVNSLLRNAQKQSAPIDLAPADEHPDWLREAIKTAWPDSADNIFLANLQAAPMTLRVNLQRGSRADYMQRLDDANIVAQPLDDQWLPSAIRLEQPVDVTELPGFADGDVSVQDAHAQLAAKLLNVRPGMQVLDACAAPGGKTAHVLESVACDMTALDIDAKRVERMQTGLARLHLQANVLQADAADVSSWWNGTPFDRVLLDAPCSATGVVRRHPDIKLTRRADDIPALAVRQLALLRNLWACLAEGGRLVYATCSVLPAENSDVVAAFLAEQTDAELLNVPDVLDSSSALKVANAATVGWQLFPNGAASSTEGDQPAWHGDGFYYAVLGKNEI